MVSLYDTLAKIDDDRMMVEGEEDTFDSDEDVPVFDTDDGTNTRTFEKGTLIPSRIDLGAYARKSS